jgi:glycine cleavage system regulatory protein
MKTYLVATVTCPDRAGIVERITDVLVGYAANWEESRMARLGGEFAGIALISVPPENAEALADALRALAAEQMTVVVKFTQASTPDARPPHSLYRLRLEGADHEGIVHKVSGTLAHQGINVESMETEVVAAPISGSPLFHMDAQIKVPPEISLDDLRANLEHIGDELGVDITVSTEG